MDPKLRAHVLLVTIYFVTKVTAAPKYGKTIIEHKTNGKCHHGGGTSEHYDFRMYPKKNERKQEYGGYSSSPEVHGEYFFVSEVKQPEGYGGDSSISEVKQLGEYGSVPEVYGGYSSSPEVHGKYSFVSEVKQPDYGEYSSVSEVNKPETYGGYSSISEVKQPGKYGRVSSALEG